MAGLTVLEIPQWQGSASLTAQRLRQGAADLAGLIPAGERLRIDADGEPGAARDGVAALDVLVRNLHAIRAARASARGQTVVTIGGDCGVDLAPIEAALAAHGPRLAVVWLDAHGDLNTPASSPSGAFHGMVLRALLGEGPRDLSPTRALRPAQVVLAGVRALDPGERAFVEDSGIPHVDVPQLAEPSTLVDVVAATGAHAVYVHIDLDVLDPQLFTSVGTKEPNGLTPDQLTAAVHALAARFTIAGLGITEYEPSRPRDQEVLARFVATLVPILDRTSSGDAAQVERFAAAAWPATHTENTRGWLLRHTPRVTRRRSNAALPPPADQHPEHALDAVEAFYRTRGLPVSIQVSPAEQHTALDAALAARGYRHAAPTLVLTAPVAQVIAKTTGHRAVAVNLADKATAAWHRAFVDLDGHSDSAAVGELVLPRVPAPAAYASVTLDGDVAAMGLFVAALGWAGVFCMTTHPQHRRQGIALAILHAGARWAAGHGADHLYLQAEHDNNPARRLYGRTGFTHSHSYHYRVANQPQT